MKKKIRKPKKDKVELWDTDIGLLRKILKHQTAYSFGVSDIFRLLILFIIFSIPLIFWNNLFIGLGVGLLLTFLFEFSAIKKVFGYVNMRGGLKTRHVVNNMSKGARFNFPIERLHNTIRQRTQGFRGFHGSRVKADLLMKGLLVYYNFIRNHQGINCSPYELATDIKLENPNRWVELIEMSC